MGGGEEGVDRWIEEKGDSRTDQSFSRNNRMKWGGGCIVGRQLLIG